MMHTSLVLYAILATASLASIVAVRVLDARRRRVSCVFSLVIPCIAQSPEAIRHLGNTTMPLTHSEHLNIWAMDRAHRLPRRPENRLDDNIGALAPVGPLPWLRSQED